MLSSLFFLILFCDKTPKDTSSLGKSGFLLAYGCSGRRVCQGDGEQGEAWQPAAEQALAAGAGS